MAKVKKNQNSKSTNSQRSMIAEPPDDSVSDEQQIMADQDETMNLELLDEDISPDPELAQNLGKKGEPLEPLEDFPSDFMEGNVDVKKQMDLTSRVEKDSILGVGESTGDDDSMSELNESFRSTPGGLEEVMMKTDEDLAHHRHPRKLREVKSGKISSIPIRIRSSVIQSVRYDRKDSVLFITFRSGQVYSYDQVPEDTYEEFMKAPSKGRYFDLHIREQYKTQKVS